MRNRIARPSPALVIAIVALFVALGGTGYAAVQLPKASVGAKHLKKNSVSSAKVKNSSLLLGDFKASERSKLHGVAGARGLSGTRGLEGLRGLTGPRGLAGEAGSQGAQGNAGADGTDGDPGSQGTLGRRVLRRLWCGRRHSPTLRAAARTARSSQTTFSVRPVKASLAVELTSGLPLPSRISPTSSSRQADRRMPAVPR
jgi:hypothetical protein